MNKKIKKLIQHLNSFGIHKASKEVDYFFKKIAQEKNIKQTIFSISQGDFSKLTSEIRADIVEMLTGIGYAYPEDISAGAKIISLIYQKKYEAVAKNIVFSQLIKNNILTSQGLKSMGTISIPRLIENKRNNLSGLITKKSFLTFKKYKISKRAQKVEDEVVVREDGGTSPVRITPQKKLPAGMKPGVYYYWDEKNPPIEITKEKADELAGKTEGRVAYWLDGMPVVGVKITKSAPRQIDLSWMDARLQQFLWLLISQAQTARWAAQPTIQYIKEWNEAFKEAAIALSHMTLEDFAMGIGHLLTTKERFFARINVFLGLPGNEVAKNWLTEEEQKATGSAIILASIHDLLLGASFIYPAAFAIDIGLYAAEDKKEQAASMIIFAAIMTAASKGVGSAAKTISKRSPKDYEILPPKQRDPDKQISGPTGKKDVILEMNLGEDNVWRAGYSNLPAKIKIYGTTRVRISSEAGQKALEVANNLKKSGLPNAETIAAEVSALVSSGEVDVGMVLSQGRMSQAESMSSIISDTNVKIARNVKQDIVDMGNELSKNSEKIFDEINHSGILSDIPPPPPVDDFFTDPLSLGKQPNSYDYLKSLEDESGVITKEKTTIDSNVDEILGSGENLPRETSLVGTQENQKIITPDIPDDLKQIAKEWDKKHRSYRSDAWFDGGKANEDAIRGFQEAAEKGGESFPAHGMSKEGTLSGAISNLLGVIANGLDPARGGGRLSYAPLVTSLSSQDAMAAGGGTSAGGIAYSDGPFILIGSPGEEFTGNLSSLKAILVNQTHVEIVPSLRMAVQKIRPDILVESYADAGKVIEKLKFNPEEELRRLNSGDQEEISDKNIAVNPGIVMENSLPRLSLYDAVANKNVATLEQAHPILSSLAKNQKILEPNGLVIKPEMVYKKIFESSTNYLTDFGILPKDTPSGYDFSDDSWLQDIDIEGIIRAGDVKKSFQILEIKKTPETKESDIKIDDIAHIWFWDSSIQKWSDILPEAKAYFINSTLKKIKKEPTASRMSWGELPKVVDGENILEMTDAQVIEKWLNEYEKNIKRIIESTAKYLEKSRGNIPEVNLEISGKDVDFIKKEIEKIAEELYKSKDVSLSGYIDHIAVGFVERSLLNKNDEFFPEHKKMFVLEQELLQRNIRTDLNEDMIRIKSKGKQDLDEATKKTIISFVSMTVANFATRTMLDDSFELNLYNLSRDFVLSNKRQILQSFYKNEDYFEVIEVLDDVYEKYIFPEFFEAFNTLVASKDKTILIKKLIEQYMSNLKLDIFYEDNDTYAYIIIGSGEFETKKIEFNSKFLSSNNHSDRWDFFVLLEHELKHQEDYIRAIIIDHMFHYILIGIESLIKSDNLNDITKKILNSFVLNKPFIKYLSHTIRNRRLLGSSKEIALAENFGSDEDPFQYIAKLLHLSKYQGLPQEIFVRFSQIKNMSKIQKIESFEDLFLLHFWIAQMLYQFLPKKEDVIDIIISNPYDYRQIKNLDTEMDKKRAGLAIAMKLYTETCNKNKSSIMPIITNDKIYNYLYLDSKPFAYTNEDIKIILIEMFYKLPLLSNTEQKMFIEAINRILEIV